MTSRLQHLDRLIMIPSISIIDLLRLCTRSFFSLLRIATISIDPLPLLLQNQSHSFYLLLCLFLKKIIIEKVSPVKQNHCENPEQEVC